jgi:hypothetical protein
MSSKAQRTYAVRVTGVRNLGYVYSVKASNKEEAYSKAKHEYRMETGDVVLHVEVVKPVSQQ